MLMRCHGGKNSAHFWHLRMKARPIAVTQLSTPGLMALLERKRVDGPWCMRLSVPFCAVSRAAHQSHGSCCAEKVFIQGRNAHMLGPRLALRMMLCAPHGTLTSCWQTAPRPAGRAHHRRVHNTVRDDAHTPCMRARFAPRCSQHCVVVGTAPPPGRSNKSPIAYPTPPFSLYSPV